MVAKSEKKKTNKRQACRVLACDMFHKLWIYAHINCTRIPLCFVCRLVVLTGIEILLVVGVAFVRRDKLVIYCYFHEAGNGTIFTVVQRTSATVQPICTKCTLFFVIEVDLPITRICVTYLTLALNAVWKYRVLTWDVFCAVWYHIVMIYWLNVGFELVIGFVEYLWLLTTSNYNALSDSRTRVGTVAYTKSTQSIFNGRYWVTVPIV
jgi:hypothetical protein